MNISASTASLASSPIIGRYRKDTDGLESYSRQHTDDSKSSSKLPYFATRSPLGDISTESRETIRSWSLPSTATLSVSSSSSSTPKSPTPTRAETLVNLECCIRFSLQINNDAVGLIEANAQKSSHPVVAKVVESVFHDYAWVRYAFQEFYGQLASSSPTGPLPFGTDETTRYIELNALANSQITPSFVAALQLPRGGDDPHGKLRDLLADSFVRMHDAIGWAFPRIRDLPLSYSSS